MKILYIAPRYEGGIGGHAKRVAEKLREKDYDIKLMFVPHVPIKNLKNLSFLFIGSLKAIFDREKYDVIHAWNIPSAFVMKYVKARKKILSVHGVYSEQVNMIHSSTIGTVASIAEEKALKLADVLTTDSKTVQKSYKEKLGLDFVHLAAPLDTNKFDIIPNVIKANNQVVYVGRDSYEKGIDILRKIESQINGKVVYCTNMEWKEAMTTLKASSILVVPSRMESIPQVIKEAYYLKVPVIATNVGGIPEIVEDEVTGILVPSNDHNKLLNAINSLLKNNDKTMKLVNTAYDYIKKNYSWQVLLPKYIELYEN